MSLAQRLLCAVAAVLVLTAAFPSAGFSGDEAWITIERGAALRAQAGLAAAGRPGALVLADAGTSRGLSIRARATDVVAARILESDVALLSEVLHKELHRCGGFVWHPTREAAEQEAMRANSRLLLRTPEPPVPYTIDNGPVVQTLIAPMQEINVRNTITTLGAFFTRYHNCGTGAMSASWIHDTWQTMATGRPDVTVEYFFHTGYTTLQPSVILTIPGTTIPNEVVVLGGHQDSIAGSNCATSRAPGEDDNASGIASLTEAIRRALASGGGGYRPQRTVKFMAYAAEEIGLRGSGEIAQSFLDQGINVVGVLQLDMTNYKGSSQDIFIYTDFTNPTQNAFVGSLVDTYLPTLTRSTSACGYGCSDHASWTNRGYPASFPFEASFSQHDPFIHTSGDVITVPPSNGNADHALKFAKLSAAYMAEVAKGGFTANQAPLASAGADHPASAFTTSLDGRASADPDSGPSPLTYSWTQVSGPPVTILDAQSAVARFRAPYLRATYVFRLTVNDGLASSTDDVTIFPRTEP